MAPSVAQMGLPCKWEAVSICGLVITLHFAPSRLAGFERSSQTEATTGRTPCSLAQAWFFDLAHEAGRKEPIRGQSTVFPRHPRSISFEDSFRATSRSANGYALEPIKTRSFPGRQSCVANCLLRAPRRVGLWEETSCFAACRILLQASRVHLPGRYWAAQSLDD